MKFQISNRMAFVVNDLAAAREFYAGFLAFPEVFQDGAPSTPLELKAGPFRLFLDKEEGIAGPVFELVVDDLEAAKQAVLEKGCEVVTWGGAGQANLIRDPFGVMFNLFLEQP